MDEKRVDTSTKGREVYQVCKEVGADRLPLSDGHLIRVRRRHLLRYVILTDSWHQNIAFWLMFWDRL